MTFKITTGRINFVAAFTLAMAIPFSAHAQTASKSFLQENKLAIALIVFVYILPGWIAWSRKHPSKWAIILIDIALGWTGIGYLVALIWSLGGTKQTVAIAPGVSASNAAPTNQNASVASSVATKSISERIADLKTMLDAGAISQTEYDLLKADAMKGLA
jgi:hypothetical protein